MVEWRNRGFVQDSDEEEADDEAEPSNKDAKDHDVDTHEAKTILDENITKARDGNKGRQRVEVAVVVEHIERRVTEDGDFREPVNRRTAAIRTSDNGKHISVRNEVPDTEDPRAQLGLSSSLQENDDVDELQDQAILPALGQSRAKPNHVLQTVLKPTPAPDDNTEHDIFDIPSSPLSEPPASPPMATNRVRHSPPALILAPSGSLSPIRSPAFPSSDTSLCSPPIIPQPFSSTADLPSSQPKNLETSHEPSPLFKEQIYTRRRNFRPRNPIQLHPYALENELYKNTLRARGIRPVVVAGPRPEQAVRHEAIDSNDIFGAGQSSSFENSSQSSIRAPSSSPPINLHGINNHSNHREMPLPGPSVGPHDSQANTGTRQGISIDYDVAEMISNRDETFRQTTGAPEEGPRISGPLRSTALPKSSKVMKNRAPKKYRLKRFKMPAGFSNAHPQVQLPTPDTSSETGRPQPVDKESETDLDSDAAITELEEDPGANPAHVRQHRQGSARVRSPSPLSISSGSSSDESEQIRAAQRRIRGVLPASYLTLNQRAQAQTRRKPEAATRADTYTLKDGNTRGIARRVATYHSRLSSGRVSSPPLLEIFEVSDNDQPTITDALLNTSVRKPIHHKRMQSSYRKETEARDLMEEDWVDPMVPIINRNRGKSTNRSKQTNIREAFRRPLANAKQDSVLQSSVWNGAAQSVHPEAQKRHRTERARRKQLPKLGIIDSTTRMLPASKPDFVKIAVRQARSRGDGGRHRPSGKIISMHDKRDEVDIMSTLDEWTRGQVSSRSKRDTELVSAKPRNHRRPLSEVSQNRQETFPSPIKLTDQLTAVVPQQSRHGRLALVPPKLTLRQSRLVVSRAVASDTSSMPKVRRIAQGVRHRTKKNTSSRTESILRPGQLEDLQIENDNLHHEVAFQRNLSALDSRFDERCTFNQRTANPLLNPYLNRRKSHEIPQLSVVCQASGVEESAGINDPTQQRKIHHRPRKRRPQRVNVNDFDIDLPPLSSTSSIGPIAIAVPPNVDQSDRQIRGLGKIGTFYTADFEVRRLGTGTYFNHTTFIGSGELKTALESPQRDFEKPVGIMSWSLGPTDFIWGGWTDEVSSQLSKVLEHLCSITEFNLGLSTSYVDPLSTATSSLTVFSTLRSISKYISTHLYFLDALDRASFLGRFLQDMEVVRNTLRARQARYQQLGFESIKGFKIRVTTYSVVIVSQLLHMAGHPTVESQTRIKIDLLLRSLIGTLAETLLTNNLQTVWTFVSQRTALESGIKDADVEIESIVILSHVITNVQLTGLRFWDALKPAFEQKALNTCTDIAVFEKTWHDIFAILPILDFDASGVLAPRSRQDHSIGNWVVIKVMLSRLFEMYSHDAGGAGPSINSYIRAVMSRCYNLVSTWGWDRSEPVLNCIFDFYAQNGFSLLHNEESKGSPIFLASLDKITSVDLEPSDRSFDIFLKTLYRSLKEMCSFYPDRKLKSIVWRLVPNGNQLLEKEKELHQHDLNMKRNHHDLLCVLYSASTSASRPNIDLIKDLVDFTSSHSEICRINIRSWNNLTRFKLSTGEPADSLNSFAIWYNKILHELMLQHRNARTEAEDQFEASKAEGNNLSADLLETTVASNQKQTEGLMIMALASLRDCVKEGKDTAAVLGLFHQVDMASVLEMFDPKMLRFNTVIVEALLVYDSYILRTQPAEINKIQQHSNEDSQEFGDWTALENVADDCAGIVQHPLEENAIMPLHKLLSNCFGAEAFYDETLLVKLTGTWSRMCSGVVKCGQRDWGYYIDHHSPGSWHQLRNTDEARKFFPYFLSLILQEDDTAAASSQDVFLADWIVSLVERESMLKFQGLLTTALLNAFPQHGLLQHLPFATDARTHTFDISLTQFRERRLALLSAFLANMRQTFEAAFLKSTNETQRLRAEYSMLLRRFMNGMKNNYQEIQQNSSTRGAYVDFVQKIVEFLQQYTNDICPIDTFFTDSAAFPLPTSDPTYVVGRLKGYTFGLSDGGTQKKLAVFLQSVCERAVADNQQGYLIEQLKKAVEGAHERGMSSTPSLRAILLQAVFPAYMGNAFTSDCGWILANVFLEASAYILDDLIFYFSVTEKNSLQATITMMTEFLQASCHMTSFVIANLSALTQPHVLRTLKSVYGAITRAASVVDYAYRCSQAAAKAVESVEYFVKFGKMVLDRPNHSLPPASMLSPILVPPTNTSFTELRAFCRASLETSLSKNWVKDDYGYHVVRGNTRREVMIDVGELAEENASLTAAIEKFFVTIERIPTFRGLVPPQEDSFAFFGGSIM